MGFSRKVIILARLSSIKARIVGHGMYRHSTEVKRTELKEAPALYIR